VKLRFEAKFAKDLRNITNAKLMGKIKDVIEQCKQADNLTQLNHIKKLQGHDTFYRIRVGDYRIGLEAVDDELIFTRCLHRKEIYRYFP
jgi:mRNA interferase RelE/StbE